MIARQVLAATAIIGVGTVLSGAAFAQPDTNNRIAHLEQTIQQLQQELTAVKNQVAAEQQQIKQSQDKLSSAQSRLEAENAQVKKSISGGYKFGLTKNNRPFISSPDGSNSIELTSRMHFDVGDYLSQKPGRGLTAATGNPLNSGVNLRRARLGVLGKFMEDWHYYLAIEVGGSPDNTTSAKTQINSAALSYYGLEKAKVPLIFDIGEFNVPLTMDQTTSSNDITFLERASIANLVSGLAGGVPRAAFGARSNNDRYFTGLYLTGPTAGDNSTAAPLNGEQVAVTARATYQILQNADYTLHAGIDAANVFTPNRSGSAAAGARETLRFRDRPELRIDQTQFVDTGSIGASGARTYGAELAGNYRGLYFQGESYGIQVDQQRAPGLAAPRLNFWGAYGQLSLALTGEARKYDSEFGKYKSPQPDHPFSLKSGEWGAWEISGRISYVDLNDHNTKNVPASTTGGVFGGTQLVYSAGLNWYVNRNVRFMFDYIHADIDKLSPTDGRTSQSNHIDAIAMRTQVAF